jgi:hypothetical protein
MELPGTKLRMPDMRISLLLIAAAALLPAADVKDFSKSVPLDAKGRFSLDTYKGSIRITAWDQPQAEIRARIEVDPGWHDLPVEDVEIRVDGSSGNVRVKTEYRRHFAFDEGNLPLVHYTIRMPRGASLDVKDYKSESEISGVQGDFEFDTYKGTARIEGIQGAFGLNTYKCDIRAIFARVGGPSRIKTYKGTIDVSLPRASSFELRADLERKAEFDCDFPRTIHSTRHESSFESVVNGGGPALRVSSYRGNIRLRGI